MAIQTPKGNTSTKIAPGKTWQRHLKIEKIVRLTGEGYSEQEIAIHLGCTKQYVSLLKRSPEYIAKRMEISSGIVSDYDKHLRNTLEHGREELRQMLPSALLAVRDAILDKSNPKLRLTAALEVLDRDGELAKVSKTQITKKEEFDFSSHDKITEDLLEALQANAKAAETPEAMQERMKKLGINEFTKAAGLATEAQAELQKRINMDDFDLGSITGPVN